MTVHIDLGPNLDPKHAARATEARVQLRNAVTALASSPPGFIEILDEGDAVAERCRAEAARLTHFDTIVVLGIGGSALGARAVRDALAPQHAARLVVIDNIDPDTIVRTRDSLDPKRTAFFVVSKSGSTAETAAQLILFRSWLEAAGCDPAEQMVLITDPENGPLRALVARDGYRSLEIPPRVGGRFSVLTPVGLLPAAVLGVDPAELLAGGRALWHAVRDHEEHPLLDWVVAHSIRAEAEGQQIQVLMSYADRLSTLGNWFAQLWGESLGKKFDRAGKVVHRGSTPLAAVGATDQHSLVQLFAEGPADKQFLILGLDPPKTPLTPLGDEAAALSSDFGYLGGHSIDELFEAERVGTIQALGAAGRAVSRLQLGKLDAATLGALFVFFELATVLAAELLDIDPYDQPGVEAGKIIAFARMGRDGYEEKAKELLGDAPEETPGIALF